jgi:hypothetical protein
VCRNGSFCFFVVCRWKIYCLSDFDELFLINSLVGKSLSEKCKRYVTFTIFDIHVKGIKTIDFPSTNYKKTERSISAP